MDFWDVWDEEGFTPKDNHHRGKKWLDHQQARRQLYWIGAKNSRKPHEIHGFLTKGGVPYFYHWKGSHRVGESPYDYTRKHYRASGFNRWRGESKGNGKKEWGKSRDAWGKPDVQGKSSRFWMKEKAAWRDEAAETLVKIKCGY